MTINIAGRPQADSTYDGVSHLAETIAAEPSESRFVVMEVRCTKVAHPVDEKGELGDVVVTLRPVHIEAAVTMEDQSLIMGLLQRRHLDRTGQDTLALEDPSAAAARDETKAMKEGGAEDVDEADLENLHRGIEGLLDSSSALKDGVEVPTCPNCGALPDDEHAAGCPSAGGE